MAEGGRPRLNLKPRDEGAAAALAAERARSASKVRGGARERESVRALECVGSHCACVRVLQLRACRRRRAESNDHG